MIGRIHGQLIEKTPPVLLVDVGGIGYEVYCPITTCEKISVTGTTVTLHIHHIVREDAQVLYGFYEQTSRAVFRELIRVSGVGPKLALAILSSMDVQTLVQSIESGSKEALLGLSGVGKKTAERLMIEMRDRLKNINLGAIQIDQIALTNNQSGSNMQNARSDAYNALIALGYKPQEANRVLISVETGKQDSETLIRLALKKLAKG